MVWSPTLLRMQRRRKWTALDTSYKGQALWVQALWVMSPKELEPWEVVNLARRGPGRPTWLGQPSLPLLYSSLKKAWYSFSSWLYTTSSSWPLWPLWRCRGQFWLKPTWFRHWIWSQPTWYVIFLSFNQSKFIFNLCLSVIKYKRIIKSKRSVYETLLTVFSHRVYCGLDHNASEPFNYD